MKMKMMTMSITRRIMINIRQMMMRIMNTMTSILKINKKVDISSKETWSRTMIMVKNSKRALNCNYWKTIKMINNINHQENSLKQKKTKKRDN